MRATPRATPELSNNYLGELTGVDGRTVARVREELEAASAVPKLTAFRVKDDKTRPRTTASVCKRQTSLRKRSLKPGSEWPIRRAAIRSFDRPS